MRFDISDWSGRVDIARKHGQCDVAEAAAIVARLCEQHLVEIASDPSLEPLPILVQANLIRKKIEASEQHRSMCVEHGLSDAAIDATYEIQSLEKQLVDLVRTLDEPKV